MAVSVVLNGPFWNPLQPVARSAATATGALLRVVARILVLLGLMVGLYWSAATFDEEQSLPHDPGGYSSGGVTVALLASAALTEFAGRRLVRRRRRLVLFLRRFGYDDATRAVLAATESVGRTWRVVTLDDASIQPVGTAPLLQRSISGLTRTAAGVRRVRSFTANLAGKAYALALIGAAVAAVLLWDDVSGEEAMGWLAAAGDTVGRGAETWLRPLLIGVAVAAVVWVVSMVTMGLVGVGSRSLDTARKFSYLAVGNEADIEQTCARLAARERAVFNPRLMVARVDSTVWQPTVARLGGMSDALLFDVSKPSENLVWEMETLLGEHADRCVFIGELDTLRRYMDRTMDRTARSGRRAGHARFELLAVAPDSPLGQVERLLDGRKVIGYQCDARGLRRFRRALRAVLESLPG
jgi:hypothetical protein